LRILKMTTPSKCGLTAVLAAFGLAAGSASAASNLSITASDSTVGVGQTLVVTIGLNGDAVQGVGAQLVLGYDRTKLQLQSNGGNHYALVNESPLDLEIYESHNSTNGTLVLALGTDEGTTNETLSGGFVTLTFTCLTDFCATSDLVTFTTVSGQTSKLSNAAATNISLSTATNLGSVTRDTVAPTFNNVPAGVSYWADANGSNAAVVAFTAPTGSDSCDNSVTITDNRAAGDSYAAGSVSTVTWTATDDCGNTATATTTVDVSADSLALASVAFGGAYSIDENESFTRGLSVSASQGASSDTDSRTISLAAAGSGASSRVEGSVNMQLSGATDWDGACASVRDPLHSLRRVFTMADLAGTGSHGGRSYNSRYAIDGTSASDYLLVGNANGDTVIDIFDFATFVSQRGSTLSLNTTASTSGPHTDFNASQTVTNADLSFLGVNYFQVDETCGSYTGQQPRSSVKVTELVRMGLGHQAIADINNDGVVNATDISLLMQGVEPRRPRVVPGVSTGTAW